MAKKKANATSSKVESHEGPSEVHFEKTEKQHQIEVESMMKKKTKHQKRALCLKNLTL